MKKGLLFLSAMLSAGFSISQDCSDLFISEYVEGWYNNKALEIYNPTPNPINLNQYMVIRYSNGATSVGSNYAVQLSGTIAPYGTYVGVVDQRNPDGTGQDSPIWDSLEVRADGFYSPDYDLNSTWYWNGNDAVVLAKGTPNNIAGAVLVDVFGKIGEDPGDGWSTNFPYTGAGVVVTADHSMIRKSTIYKGETNPTISFFNPLDQWDTIPPVIVRLDENGDPVLSQAGNPILDGNWGSLGTHTCGCQPASFEEIEVKEEIKIFPNPTSGVLYVKNTETVVKLEVVNSLGQLVYEVRNLSKSVLTIDLGNHKGVYFIRFREADGTSSLKRVVVK
jgi:hypothetical protein